jgi:glycosyltransferase involved in cell wall biosynthesis
MSGSVVASQLGARMHYAVPRILGEAGRLERFYTDICAVQGFPRLLALVPRRLQPRPIRRLAGRVPAVPGDKLRSFPLLGAYQVARRMRATAPADVTRLALLDGKAFSRAVAAAGFGQASGFYGIAGECLEQLEAARAQGLWTAVEQIIAPREIVDRLIAGEAARFPDWAESQPADPYAAAFALRERAEWAAADLVVCPSEFVRDSVAAVGGPAEKCVLVPYGIEIGRFAVPERRRGDRLRVLTVGAVGLRKGSPYVVEAAREMLGEAQFRMVGAIGKGLAGSLLWSPNLELCGAVPRAEMAAHFAWADVFLLPSACEGSATVTYEALAAGLPVIATPNAGSVVEDGVSGFVVPLGAAQPIVIALRALAGDAARLDAMSAAARERAADYDIAAYGRRLLAALAPLQRRTEGKK